MKFSAQSLAALVFGLVVTVPAAAATITFDDLPFGTTSSITSQGLTFDRPAAAPQFIIYPMNIPANADLNGKTLALINGGGITVHAADNSLFDLTSLDIAEVQNNINYSNAVNVLFTFNTATGSTQQTVAIDGTPGLQTLIFNQTDLTSFSISSSTRYTQIDNVVFSTAGASSDVPEPASWAMMIGGFGMIGGTLRSRNRAKVSFG